MNVSINSILSENMNGRLRIKVSFYDQNGQGSVDVFVPVSDSLAQISEAAISETRAFVERFLLSTTPATADSQDSSPNEPEPDDELPEEDYQISKY